MTLKDVVSFLQQGGLLAWVLIILYAGYKGWWVWGWQYKKDIEDIKTERDVYRRLALKGTSIAEQLAGVPSKPDDKDDG